MPKRTSITLGVALAVAVIYGRVEAQGGPTPANLARSDVKKFRTRSCQKGGQPCQERRASTVFERAIKYEPLIAQAALRYQVDPYLLWTIAYLETRFRPESVSAKGARGMMQFMPATAARYGLLTSERMHDPTASIDAAARHLRDLKRRFENRAELILAAYNAGEGAVVAYRSGQKLHLSGGKTINPRGIKTNGIPPYPETLGYVSHGQRVLRAIASVGIFPRAFLAHCPPKANQAEFPRQFERCNALHSTHSIYVIAGGVSEETQAATQNQSEYAEKSTGSSSAGKIP